MARMVFIKDPIGWDLMVRGPQGPVSLMLLKKGRRLTALARQQAGSKSGKLKASMGYALMPYRGSLQVQVGSNSKYALFHHEGTRPHIIRARNGRSLQFAGYGKINYRTQILHPGTKPNRFLTDNLPVVVLS